MERERFSSPWPTGTPSALARILDGPDGYDEEAGSVDALGFAGMIRRSKHRGGYIVRIDSQGFKTYETFDTEEALESEWYETARRLDDSGSDD